MIMEEDEEDVDDDDDSKSENDSDNDDSEHENDKEITGESMNDAVLDHEEKEKEDVKAKEDYLIESIEEEIHIEANNKNDEHNTVSSQEKR